MRRLAFAALFALAACGGSTSPSSRTSFKSLDPGEQLVFENDAVLEVESTVSSFVSFDPYSGFGFARVSSRAASLATLLPGEVKQRPRFQNLGDCQPTLSGDASDADSDGIFANVTSTFDCDTTFTGGSISETGTVTLS